MFVKICGVRTVEDATLVAHAGADAIGLNFWPRSRRYLTYDQAADLRKWIPSSLQVWGVFVDAPPEEIERALDGGLIDVAQLHGHETPADCARFLGRHVKAIRLHDESSLLALASFSCDPILVDAGSTELGELGENGEMGGTGRRADVTLAATAAAGRRVILAGGLDAHNVAAAVRAVRPYGVDVASGVEKAPGLKDPHKLAAFVAAAKGS